MVSLRRLQMGVRRRVARWLAPVEQAGPGQTAFYPQQPSCQVPDLWSLFSRFLGEREAGTFVEVGAYDGVFVSNTWGLAERGWHGLMVEPVPHLAEQCRQNHSSHPNVRVVECAIGPADTPEVRLHLAGTLTTANAEAFHEYEGVDWASPVLTSHEVVVPCQTLDVFLTEHQVPKDFDVLVVDVEGFETEVFSEFTIGTWAPKMIIVELADTHPDLSSTSAKDARLGTQILGEGYRIVFKDRVNTIFVRHDVWEGAYRSVRGTGD